MLLLLLLVVVWHQHCRRLLLLLRAMRLPPSLDGLLLVVRPRMGERRHVVPAAWPSAMYWRVWALRTPMLLLLLLLLLLLRQLLPPLLCQLLLLLLRQLLPLLRQLLLLLLLCQLLLLAHGCRQHCQPRRGQLDGRAMAAGCLLPLLLCQHLPCPQMGLLLQQVLLGPRGLHAHHLLQQHGIYTRHLLLLQWRREPRKQPRGASWHPRHAHRPEQHLSTAARWRAGRRQGLGRWWGAGRRHAKHHPWRRQPRERQSALLRSLLLLLLAVLLLLLLVVVLLHQCHHLGH